MPSHSTPCSALPDEPAPLAKAGRMSTVLKSPARTRAMTTRRMFLITILPGVCWLQSQYSTLYAVLPCQPLSTGSLETQALLDQDSGDALGPPLVLDDKELTDAATLLEPRLSHPGVLQGQSMLSHVAEG